MRSSIFRSVGATRTLSTVGFVQRLSAKCPSSAGFRCPPSGGKRCSRQFAVDSSGEEEPISVPTQNDKIFRCLPLMQPWCGTFKAHLVVWILRGGVDLVNSWSRESAAFTFPQRRHFRPSGKGRRYRGGVFRHSPLHRMPPFGWAALPASP